MTLSDLLGASIASGLRAKTYENRISVADDIESLVSKSFDKSSSKAVTWADDCLDCINEELTKSLYPEHRKGGLVAFVSIIIGSRCRVSDQSLKVAITRSTELLSDEDAKVRAAACEALYNVLRACRGRCIDSFSSMFLGLCRLQGDADPDNRQMAPLLDRALKEAVTEYLQSGRDDRVLSAILSTFALPSLTSKQVCLSWITVIKSLPKTGFFEKLSFFIPHILSLICSDTSMVAGWRDVAVSADHTFGNLLKDLEFEKTNPLLQLSIEDCVKVLTKYGRFQDSLTSDRSRVLLFEWIRFLGPLSQSPTVTAELVIVLVKSFASETSQSVFLALEETNNCLLKNSYFTSIFDAEFLIVELENLLPSIPNSSVAIDWISIASTRYPFKNIDLLLSVRLDQRIIDVLFSNFAVDHVACKLLQYTRGSDKISLQVSQLIVDHFQECELIADFLNQVAFHIQREDRMMLFELLRSIVLSGKFTNLWSENLVDSVLANNVIECNIIAAMLIALVGKRWTDFLTLSQSLSPEQDLQYIEKFVPILESNFLASNRILMFQTPEFSKGLASMAMILPQTSPAFQPLFNRLQLVSIFRSV